MMTAAASDNANKSQNNANHEFTSISMNGIRGHHQSAYEEEEKGDNAGSMRAPKSTAMILGEDHGSKGNN